MPGLSERVFMPYGFLKIRSRWPSLEIIQTAIKKKIGLSFKLILHSITIENNKIKVIVRFNTTQQKTSVDLLKQNSSLKKEQIKKNF
jgi:hypothetical protein